MAAASELKSLYRDYSLALLTREQYRAARAPILDAAASGPAEAPVEEADKTRPKELRPVEPAAAAAAQETVAASPVARSAGPSRWPLFAAVPVVAVAALAAWFVYRAPDGSSGERESPLAEAPAAGDTSTSAQADRARSLARKFLFANDWSEESVRAFVAAWQSLTPDERAAAEVSVWMPGVVETVRRYVQEERALLAAAGLPPDVSQSLAELAELFGIDARNLPVATERLARTDVPPTGAVMPAAAAPAQPESRKSATLPSVTEPTTTAAPAAQAAARASEAESGPSPAPSAPATQAPAARPEATAQSATPMRTEAAEGSGAAPDKCPASLVRKKERFCRDTLAGGQPGPLLVVVPPGRYRMGSDLAAEERPAHDVTLARPIAIGVHEVSVDEYRAFCESAGHACPASQGLAGDVPVVMVSWRDAVAYVEWLSAQTGHKYRLPSEAEWEYAARGGTQTRYPYGDELTSADAAFSGPRPRSAAAARTERFNRNAFSLYHVVGNVREWVQDDWSPGHEGAPADGGARRGGGSEKVVRGGSFADGFDGVRSSARQPMASGAKDARTGFRVAREIR